MRVIIKNLQKKIPVNPKRIKQAVLKVLSSERAFTVKKSGESRPSFKHRALFKEGRGEITIIFVDDKTIRELNLMYLGRDCATDVISFDYTINPECSNSGSYSSGSRRDATKKKLHSGREILADIAISCDTALRNARIFKTKPQDEICLYVTHGVLHLLGYDDNTKKNRLIMQKREEYLLWQYIKPRQ